MTERITRLLEYVRSKKHRSYRQQIELELASEFHTKNLSDVQRAAERLTRVLEQEKPVILPDQKIAYMRTICHIPEIYTESEWQKIKQEHYVHELGRVFNVCPDYATTIASGLESRRQEIAASFKTCEARHDNEGQEVLHAMLRVIDAVENLADRYAEEAARTGKQDIALILHRVPKYGARTFHEALQFFRILHFTLWCSGNYHNTVGRLDQFMFPYFKADLDAGRLNEDTAFELLEEFFISFNLDSDLYPGMQQGDNGQSVVLGGVDAEGNDAYNLLSEMCLQASLELQVIDPKINLRVHDRTDMAAFESGTRLTKQGLGFPQYSNDEIVIPGLVAKGYDLHDARNYVVAACWEFIIPKVGMDIPNIGALSFVKMVDRCLHRDLLQSNDFHAFMAAVNTEIQREIDAMTAKFTNIFMEPGPFISLLMDDCVARARDISAGAKYNNYGIHGTGLANAADSLAAIKKYVFEKREFTPQMVIQAIDANFEGYEHLWATMRQDELKMGNNEDEVDALGSELLTMFANALAGKTNDRGGCYRAGTGSAMYYLWHAGEVGASPDGRRKGDPLSANYSPGLRVKTKGPVSIIKSFTKPDLTKVINGGPLTLELHDSVFRNEESIQKVAMLVKSYIDMGGHQLQLNTVNRDLLLQAQQHPEQHRNVIVRVWGWSGYFVELDKEYQDHIIQRAELKI